MLATAEFEVNNRTFDDLESAFEAAFGNFNRALDKATPELRRELDRVLQRVAQDLRDKHGQPWPGGNPSKNRDHLFKRSGEGLDRIERSIRVSGNRLDDLVGSISATGHMAVQEEGATITPKRSKFLTVPLPAALDNRGIPIKTSAREWDRTFVQKSKKGNLLIFQNRGRDIVPLYVLKKRVKIPPRLDLEGTIESNLPFFKQRLLDTLDKELSP